MKKILTIIATLAIAVSMNAQDWYIGGGLDMSFISYPDGVEKDKTELVLSGQYDKLDLMVGFGLHEPKTSTKYYDYGVYLGRNVGKWSFGGYLGYELIEKHYSGYSINSTVQYDMLMIGVYAKFTIFDCFKLFTFYKLGYDNNNTYSKFSDRGFGVGLTIGFPYSDKEISTGYYYY